MRKTTMWGLVVSVFAVGAYSGMAAQKQGPQGPRYEPGVYLPRLPQEGDQIKIAGRGERCIVVSVSQQWVRCANPTHSADAAASSSQRQEWHNVYNGHTHDVLVPKP